MEAGGRDGDKNFQLEESDRQVTAAWVSQSLSPLPATIYRLISYWLTKSGLTLQLLLTDASQSVNSICYSRTSKQDNSRVPWSRRYLDLGVKDEKTITKKLQI